MNKSRIFYTTAIAISIAAYSLSINSATEPFQLMTEEEAQALQQKLSTLKGAEREQYRREAYELLAEKAKAAGERVAKIFYVDAGVAVTRGLD